MSSENARMQAGKTSADAAASASSSSSPITGDSSESGGRKRGRSPPGAPFVTDYRPYGTGLLQLHRRTQGAEMHKKQWDLYYRNNTINGYKDRHYILREFHELRIAIDAAAEAAVRAQTAASALDGRTGEGEGNADTGTAASSFSWMEAGCGVGNAMLPIFEQYGHLPQWRALLGFDISSVAIRLLEEKKAQLAPELAAKVHVCVLNPSESDVTACTFFAPPSSPPQQQVTAITSASVPRAVPCAFPEFVSLIFVLCSIPVSSHAVVMRRIAQCMKLPGGVLYFRDYAVSDHAEARFQQRSHRRGGGSGGTGEDGSEDNDACNTYERTNGTLSHFFSVEEVRHLFESAGFEVIALGIIENEVVNRKTSVSFARKFVQGRFRLLAKEADKIKA